MWTMTAANHPGYSGRHSPIPRCGRGPSRSMPFKRSKSVSAGYLVQNASMGPPPFSSGNAEWPPGWRLHPQASMGPPPFGSENPRRNWSCTTVPLAGFNGVTAFRQWKRPAAPRRRPRRTRFNGATAFRQWKRRYQALTRWPHRRFNGATAFRQWKLGLIFRHRFSRS